MCENAFIPPLNNPFSDSSTKLEELFIENEVVSKNYSQELPAFEYWSVTGDVLF